MNDKIDSGKVIQAYEITADLNDGEVLQIANDMIDGQWELITGNIPKFLVIEYVMSLRRQRQKEKKRAGA